MNNTYLKRVLFLLISVNAVGCITCPDYEMPNCKPGTQLVSQKDDLMCSFATCEPMRELLPLECPFYEAPECDEYSGLEWEYDETGCEVPVCVPYADLHCDDGVPECHSEEGLMYLGINEDGCEIWECRSVYDGDIQTESSSSLRSRDPEVVATVTWSEGVQYRQQNIILSEDRLSVSIEADSVNDTLLADAFTSTGKWYWEITLHEYANASYNGIGVCSDEQITEVGADFSGGIQYDHGGLIMTDDMDFGFISGESYEPGDTIGVVLNAELRKVWFIAHGLIIGGGDPTLGTGGLNLSHDYDRWAPCLNMSQGYVYRANFGQEDWVYGQPEGFTIPSHDH